LLFPGAFFPFSPHFFFLSAKFGFHLFPSSPWNARYSPHNVCRLLGQQLRFPHVAGRLFYIRFFFFPLVQVFPIVPTRCQVVFLPLSRSSFHFPRRIIYDSLRKNSFFRSLSSPFLHSSFSLITFPCCLCLESIAPARPPSNGLSSFFFSIATFSTFLKILLRLGCSLPVRCSCRVFP